MIGMLRRRLMGGGKKMWTVEVQDGSPGKYNASAIYPLINGAKRGTGVYEVNDGDTIMLYARGNNYASVFGAIRVNGTLVASAGQNKSTSYAYKVNLNCKIEVYNQQGGGTAAAQGTMHTYLTT